MKSNWSYGPETANLGFHLCNLDFWPLTLNFYIDITSVIGNHFWKFHEDTMMGTYWKRCEKHRQTVIFLKGNPFENVICKMLAIFFRPKYRLIWCLFFIKVYHQPKLKREIVHISKFQNKILYQSKKKNNWYILNFIEALAGSQLMKIKAVLNNFYNFISNPSIM